MLTINNLVTPSTGAIKNTQNEMNELKNQYKGKEIDSAEYREKMEALKDQKAAIVAAGINGADNNLVTNLFSYMNNGGSGNGGTWGGGTFDNSVFFGSGSEISQLQAMNSARIGIENRARTLVGEIGRDRARGFDVSGKQEALGNLTGNLDILSKNLSDSIDRAMGDGRTDVKYVDVMAKIKASLAPTPAEDTEKTEEDKSVTEQVNEASKEYDPEDASIAEQIANNAKSDYAEGTDVLTGEE
ncbi:MAG: hypothetical protein FWF94_07120 [Oscillospiraceae bacterium]|nr:hypothetical protein [Oscillospiraceae bacterium]